MVVTRQPTTRAQAAMDEAHADWVMLPWAVDNCAIDHWWEMCEIVLDELRAEQTKPTVKGE